MTAFEEVPILQIQTDWDECVRQDNSEVWVSCKYRGKESCHGKIIGNGLASNYLPRITSSDEFCAKIYTRKAIRVVHKKSGNACLFVAPEVTYKALHKQSVTSVAATCNGLGLSASSDKMIVWEVANGSMRRILEGHVGDVYRCRFFPSGVVALSTAADMQLKIWSVETGQCPVTLKGHSAAVTDVCIVDKGRNIISVSKDGSAKLWDCGESTCLADLIKLSSVINTCCIAITNESLKIGEPTEPVSSREIGTKDKILIVGCEDGTLAVISVYTRELIATKSVSSPINCSALLPKDCFVIGCQNGQLLMFEIKCPLVHCKSWHETESPVLCVTSFRHLGFFAGHADGSCVYYHLAGITSRKRPNPEVDLPGFKKYGRYGKKAGEGDKGKDSSKKSNDDQTSKKITDSGNETQMNIDASLASCNSLLNRAILNISGLSDTMLENTIRTFSGETSSLVDNIVVNPIRNDPNLMGSPVPDIFPRANTETGNSSTPINNAMEIGKEFSSENNTVRETASDEATSQAGTSNILPDSEDTMDVKEDTDSSVGSELPAVGNMEIKESTDSSVGSDLSTICNMKIGDSPVESTNPECSNAEKPQTSSGVDQQNVGNNSVCETVANMKIDEGNDNSVDVDISKRSSETVLGATERSMQGNAAAPSPSIEYSDLTASDTPFKEKSNGSSVECASCAAGSAGSELINIANIKIEEETDSSTESDLPTVSNIKIEEGAMDGSDKLKGKEEKASNNQDSSTSMPPTSEGDDLNDVFSLSGFSALLNIKNDSEIPDVDAIKPMIEQRRKAQVLVEINNKTEDEDEIKRDSNLRIQLTGSNYDPIYDIASNDVFIFTACRDGKIRRYCVGNYITDLFDA